MPLVRLFALLILCAVAPPAAAAPLDQFLAPAQDVGMLTEAIELERPTSIPPEGVTGITVPHHLLAADLIARGFWAASAGDYDRIILLSPDHFRKVPKAFATTHEDLATVFGAVEGDDPAITALIDHAETFTELETVAGEHGLLAVAPFIKHFFPNAKVIPVLASINATEADWAAAAEALAPLVGERTLIVQSTDYSHYRPLAEAIARDQETLAMIAAGDPAAIAGLLQPSHMDSLASQFIQMTLQAGIGSAPAVIANRNSAEYGGGGVVTTSYIVAAYLRAPAAASVFTYPDQSQTFFAGDTLLGRFLLPALRDPKAWAAIADYLLTQTAGAPLVVNLEGVLLPEEITGVDFNAHVMVTEVVAPILTELNVVAASLANNHANDLGETGLAESIQLLTDIGITPLEHGKLADLGAFRVVALNFLHGKFAGDNVIDPDQLGQEICNLAADPPLIAFVHWGEEYTTDTTAEQRGAAEQFAACGVSLIVGAHSHQASPAITPIAGGRAQAVFSVGNFLFDQTSPRGSGALLELRVFEQGTFAVRLLPIENLFELGRAVLVSQ